MVSKIAAKKELAAVAKELVKKPKGILAMDESTGTIEKRLIAVGLKSTEDVRRAYREMIVTTKGLGKYVSGTILFDETFWQKGKDGTRLIGHLKKQKIILGIKVDTGPKDNPNFSGGKITEGLETLPERLPKYRKDGAKFSKWRAVLTVDFSKENSKALVENMIRMAKYAKLCQDNGIVPIPEPEFIMDGSHGIDDCYKKTKEALTVLFSKMKEEGVYLPGILLKPNMIHEGKDSKEKNEAAVIAKKTIKVLKECVPKETGGIVFLSGGLSDDDATNFLKEINKSASDLPWNVSFSYGRALQDASLKRFAKLYPGNASEAQDILLKRAKACSDAVK